jgi:hypothetical protein
MHQLTTSISQRLFRDDVKAGNFLNRVIRHSPFDYKRGQCYYSGNPIKLAVCFFDHLPMNNGYRAEFAIATGEGFRFSKSTFKNVLAIFFENAKFNNTRLEALIPPWNEQALRLARLTGFKEEGRLREVAKDGDRVIFSMLKKEFQEIYGRNIK